MSKKSKEHNKDSSNEVVDIVQLSENVLENQLKTVILELESKCLALNKTIDKLLSQLQLREEEISQLRSFIPQTSKIGEINLAPISDEELIADVQLRRLKDSALLRDLTLDETKKLDLFVKTKKISQNGQTLNTDKSELPKELPKAQLIHLASKKIEPAKE